MFHILDIIEQRIERPPVKVLRMPASLESAKPAADGAKKAPPPVARKPSRSSRSSLLSIISNQTGSTSSQPNCAKSPASPSSQEAEPSTGDQTEVFEKENQMPPPPSNETLAELAAGADVAGMDESNDDDLDFPPPPDEGLIQEALDRINSKYETSHTALSLNKNPDDIDMLPPHPENTMTESASMDRNSTGDNGKQEEMDQVDRAVPSANVTNELPTHLDCEIKEKQGPAPDATVNDSDMDMSPLASPISESQGSISEALSISKSANEASEDELVNDEDHHADSGYNMPDSASSPVPLPGGAETDWNDSGLPDETPPPESHVTANGKGKPKPWVKQPSPSQHTGCCTSDNCSATNQQVETDSYTLLLVIKCCSFDWQGYYTNSTSFLVKSCTLD